MIKVTNIRQYTTAIISKWPLKRIKSVRLTNVTEIYSLNNGKKNDINNLTQKHLPYKQVVAWSFNEVSAAPLSD